MHRLFISDLHLDPSRPDITRAFLRFIDEQARSADELYILGDFFESWIGDDDSSELIETIRSALRSLSQPESGAPTAVFFMHGNRDFLLSEAFCRSCGMTLLNDPSTIELNGVKTLLLHGDSLCIDDVEYMQFRKMLRSAAWQQDVLSKPLDERRALAQHLRMASKEANSNKAQDIMDVNSGEVLRVINEASAALMIHGHTHRPARHLIKESTLPAERIVLGDWENSAIFLRSNKDNLSLETWPVA
ncbi:UDP-2,3-diacylglucosamine diphosphatase [Spongiibacter sp. KMU-158]|uniref:UDP-2,3-diacylglucosamine hydrolase n=1 Tax=Spongiibacter pelagi TaxID=2760804 RepID=A0A927C3J5_9GAMM|nr:UDP-2,3-diacylglucosamine diphosphatase [Spongiibacter pelagi]MBD2859116.1 UDP-2,3-diacylglucosamine diphosphatase [Spongiibacter pelagi]